MADLDSPQNLYAKNLRQSFGYPLRIPEPMPSLPPSYAESGLQIGDVGYVNHRGMFHVLFNIRFPPDHELHRSRRMNLTGLVGLTDFDPGQVPCVPGEISVGRAVCHGLQGPQGGKLMHNKGVPCKFESYSTSGAVLILPSGAVSQDLDETVEKEFCELAEKYALEWCKAARRHSLYLITGFYKASSWHLGSFHNIRPTGQVLLERDEAGEYTWSSRCDYRQSPADNSSENQTVLISGFKIEVREWDEHVLVERLLCQRSLWSEFTLLISWLYGILFFFWNRLASAVHVNRLMPFSEPFHPSDFINSYLLDKYPNARIAITHDNEWLSMLKENKVSHEVMLDAGCFRTFLESEHIVNSDSGRVVYFRKKENSDESKSGGDVELQAPPLKTFSIPIVRDGIRKLVITRIRAENIVPCLGRLPVGFYVISEFNGTTRKSQCKSASVRSNVIEWDDIVILPMELAMKIRFLIVASFEFAPMFGNGETLRIIETTVGDLALGKSTRLLYSPKKGKNIALNPSLLVTVGEWQTDSFFGVWTRKINLASEVHSCLEPEVTDKGHDAFLRYHKGEGTEKLLESLEHFKQALSLCPPNHECHAAALVNYANATFVYFQVYGATSDLDVATDLFRKALMLRRDLHSDRPMTLLRLAQALLYRQDRIRFEQSVSDEIEFLVKGIKQICSEDSYDYLAANLVLQTLKRHQVTTSGKLTELNEFVRELDRSARMSPHWHIDKPCRLVNLGTALRRCFEISGRLDYIDESISVMEEAVQLVPDVLFDKLHTLASLGDVLLVYFIQRGDASDLERSTSMIEEAVKRVPDGHFDKLRVLALLSTAFRIRYMQHGDAADLDSSLSLIEDGWKKHPDSNLYAPWMLVPFVDALRMRFLHHGTVGDLTRAAENTGRFVLQDFLDNPQMLISLCDLERVQYFQGDIESLDNPISAMEDALQSVQDGHVEKPRMLASLGDALCLRFSRRSGADDREKSISAIQAAIKLTQDSHIEKPRMLSSLGNALLVRFVQCGDVADLGSSISAVEAALKLVRDGHIEKPRILASLGDVLLVRFTQHGEVMGLENSISMIDASLKLIWDGHIEKPRVLGSLGSALLVRFAQHGNVANLEDSISMMKTSLKLVCDRHVKKPYILASLGSALLVRHAWCGDAADLQNSVSIINTALESTPQDNVERPHMLASLSEALRIRFVRFGNTNDLERSISAIRAAVKVAPNNHVEKPRMRVSLGDALCVRFVECGAGDTTDFDDSITMIEATLERIPDGHIKRPWMLTRLAVVLLIQFISTNISDLNKSVRMAGSSIYSIPSVQLSRPDPFAPLSVRDPAVLERAIAGYRDAIKLLLDDSPYRASCLTALSNALLVRFLYLGDASDLEEAVSKSREAVELISDCNPDRSECLNNLALCLKARFEHFRWLDDIKQAILTQKQAVELTPHDHRDRIRYLGNVEKAIWMKERTIRLALSGPLHRNILTPLARFQNAVRCVVHLTRLSQRPRKKLKAIETVDVHPVMVDRFQRVKVSPRLPRLSRRK